MKLSTLIAAVGDENIQLQNILHSSPNIRTGKKHGTIVFHTSNDKTQDLIDQIVTGEHGKFTAILLWIPTDKIPKDAP